MRTHGINVKIKKNIFLLFRKVVIIYDDGSLYVNVASDYFFMTIILFPPLTKYLYIL
jgi:hypothetical protein